MNRTIAKAADSIIFIGLLSLVVFTPLAFGATQPWAVCLFQTVVGLVTAFWFVRLASERSCALRPAPLLYLPLALFAAFTLFQTLPLPESLAGLLSPKALSLRETAASLLEAAPAGVPLSVYPDATVGELLRFVSYALVFFLAFHELRGLRRIHAVLGLLVVLGFVIAFFAIIQKFTWTGRVYWVRDIPDVYGVFGPFVNYDHYGGYINMVIMAGIGLILSGIEPQKKVLTGFMVVVMIASLLLSRSRGAVISFLGGIAWVSFVLFHFRRNFEKRVLVTAVASLAAIVGLVALFVYWIDWGTVMSRLKTIITLEKDFFGARLDIWTDSLGMARDFFGTGAGLGTYATAFPAYQTTWTELFWRHAHNDYLQAFIESGPLALVLAGTFVTGLFIRVFRKLKGGAGEHLSGLLAGCSAALVTMLLHSFVDFNLRITANAFLFALMAGMTAALAGLSREPRSGEVRVFGPAGAGLIAAAGILAAAVFIAVPSGKRYLAYREYAEACPEEGGFAPGAGMRLERAVALAPGNALYRHRLGLYYQTLAASEPGIAARTGLLFSAKSELSSAASLSPASGRYWASCAWLLGNLRNIGGATSVFDHALRLAPNTRVVRSLYDRFTSHAGIAPGEGARPGSEVKESGGAHGG